MGKPPESAMDSGGLPSFPRTHVLSVGRGKAAAGGKEVVMSTIEEAMEFLSTLPRDARVSISIGADGATARALRFPHANADVIAESVWCRADIAAMLEDAGREPSDANIDAVLASNPRGLEDFGDRLTEEGWDILHVLYDDAIESL